MANPVSGERSPTSGIAASIPNQILAHLICESSKFEIVVSNDNPLPIGRGSADDLWDSVSPFFAPKRGRLTSDSTLKLGALEFT
jgi:hypothetical protein